MSSYPTILSLLQTSTDGILPSGNASSLHPLAINDPKLSELRSLAAATGQLSQVLSRYLTQPINEQKHVATLRQHTQHANKIFMDQQAARRTAKELQGRGDVQYAEDVPLDRALLLAYIVERIRHWAKGAGMDVFEDNSILTLAGKSLVIDVHIQTPGDEGIASISSVKVTSASSNASQADLSSAGAALTTTSSPHPKCSTTPGALIKAELDIFVREVQKEPEEVDCRKVAKCGAMVAKHFAYLMQLDATAHTDGGTKWFDIAAMTASKAEKVMELEGEAIAQSLDAPLAPLDIFVNRAHGLPLPFLDTPGLTFLVYLPPLHYLTLLRADEGASPSPVINIKPLFDIPLVSLRHHLHDRLLPAGATCATLLLESVSSNTTPSFSSLSDTEMQDAFAPTASFPVLSDGLPSDLSDCTFPTAMTRAWVLDFGAGGVVMSKSRIRKLSTIVGLDPPVTGLGVPLYYDGLSWMDLLLNTKSTVPTLRFASSIKSANEMSPDLRNTIISTREPGFILGKLRVTNLAQVWAIIEVVQEQCWLNEMLRGCQFAPASTAQTLDALLEGNLPPTTDILASIGPSAEETDGRKRIPVAYSVIDMDEAVGLSIAFPTNDGGPTLTTFQVLRDRSSPRGIRVILGDDPSMIDEGARERRRDALEEVVRRGGLVGVPQRLWTI